MKTSGLIALITDFGTKEHFVGVMKGVALTINKDITIIDITHEIEPYNILNAANVLSETIKFWPPGSVFTAVVDPGVGTERKGVIAVTKEEHYIVAPDNGLLTLLLQEGVIHKVYYINDKRFRRPGSNNIHTFHGRDVFIYVASLIASNKNVPEEMGKEIPIDRLVLLSGTPDVRIKNNELWGVLTNVEMPFGNISTNISSTEFHELFDIVEKAIFTIEIWEKDKKVFDKDLFFSKTFGGVSAGEPMIYFDSSDKVGLAVNKGNFSQKYDISYGNEWGIGIKKRSP